MFQNNKLIGTIAVFPFIINGILLVLSNNLGKTLLGELGFWIFAILMPLFGISVMFLIGGIILSFFKKKTTK